MILIVGGVGAGKRCFVQRELQYRPEEMSSDEKSQTPVLWGIEQLAARSPLAVEELCRALAGREVLIANEVGSGVIPLDAAERAWREKAGRLCTLLAAQADVVIRLVCGIPQVIKQVKR